MSVLAKLTVWGLLLAITSEGPNRPEIGGNSELVPFKRKEKKGGGRRTELLFLEDTSSNCQTLILWFRREIVRNGNDLTQKAKSIFPLALMTLKILSRCVTSWKGRRSAKEESGREGKVMNHQQKIAGGKFFMFPLKKSCYF